MLDLNTHVAKAIAKNINDDFGVTTIGAFEVCALADGRHDMPLKDFIAFCRLYADISMDQSPIAVFDGIAYCTFCGEQLETDQCICTMDTE